MIDVEKIRKDFPILDGNHQMQGHKLVYFDNAATMLTPKIVDQAINDYYENNGTNPHGADYELSQMAEAEYEKSRAALANFLGAKPCEIVFTAGATAALNAVAQMLGETLQAGDEVLITQAEHASNILPWFKVQKERKIVVKCIPLDASGRCTLENVKKAITAKTKVISIAHITNVLGYVLDAKSICDYAHQKGIIVALDGAQSAAHIKVDVKDIDCDFYSITGHKLCGPTGIGAFYAKTKWLEVLHPYELGGGMNARFDINGNYSFINPPQRFEAGTPNVGGAIGLAAAIGYVSAIGMENIAAYEQELKQYAVSKLKTIQGIVIYNADSESGIVTFNKTGIFAQDLATHYNKYGICVRAGHHCAKLLKDFLHTPATVRISLSYYNTKAEIDYFIEITKKGDEYLDVFF